MKDHVLLQGGIYIEMWNYIDDFKIFYRITEPFSTKLVIKYPWVNGIQVFLNEGLHHIITGKKGEKSENFNAYQILAQSNFRNQV